MAIDKTQDNPTKEGQDADAPVKYTLTKDGQLTVGAMVFDRAHWVIGGKTTRAQLATLYAMAMGATGNADADALDVVTVFLDGVVDADKIKSSLSAISNAADKAKDAARVDKYRSILSAYNDGNAADVKAMAKKYLAAQTKIDALNADVDKIRATLVESLDLDAGKLGVVVWLPKEGRFWIDADALNADGKRAHGQRSTVKRGWTATMNLAVASAKRYGVEFKATAKGTNVDADGNGDWVCTLTRKGQKTVTKTGKGKTLHAVFEKELYVPTMRAHGVTPKDKTPLKDQPTKKITLNTVGFFGVPTA